MRLLISTLLMITSFLVLSQNDSIKKHEFQLINNFSFIRMYDEDIEGENYDDVFTSYYGNYIGFKYTFLTKFENYSIGINYFYYQNYAKNEYSSTQFEIPISYSNLIFRRRAFSPYIGFTFINTFIFNEELNAKFPRHSSGSMYYKYVSNSAYFRYKANLSIDLGVSLNIKNIISVNLIFNYYIFKNDFNPDNNMQIRYKLRNLGISIGYKF